MSDNKIFRVSDILPALGARLIHGNPQTIFKDFCIDSRYVEDGSIFVPLMGQNRDGHQYIIDSLNKGAVAALVRAGHHQIHEIVSWIREKASRGFSEYELVCVIEVRHTLVALQKLSEWYRRQFDSQVIAITGSVGKTGTKEMLIQLLSNKFATVGTEKNFNNEIGVPLALGKINASTKKTVIEMAMRSRGEISLLSRIARPDCAVITNTLGSHVGRLGSFAEVYRAKAEIVDGLKPGGIVYLNRRDDNTSQVVEVIQSRREGADATRFKYFDSTAAYGNTGIHPFSTVHQSLNGASDVPDADIWIEDCRMHGLSGSDFKLCTADEKVDIHLNLLGRGAIDNLTCAAAVALDQGMTLTEIAEIAPELLPAPQRLNLFQLRDNLWLIDDCYNSSPASAQDSLELMLSVDPSYKKILVLGDMLELGKFETLLHRQFAMTALNQDFDYVFAVGPRMNAVNEVECNEDTKVFFIGGMSDYSYVDDSYSQPEPQFGKSMRDGFRSSPRQQSNVILDDQSATKLSALLLNLLNQNGDEPMVIMVKGSRALHLERVVNDLLSGTYY